MCILSCKQLSSLLREMASQMRILISMLITLSQHSMNTLTMTTRVISLQPRVQCLKLLKRSGEWSGKRKLVVLSLSVIKLEEMVIVSSITLTKKILNLENWMSHLWIKRTRASILPNVKLKLLMETRKLSSTISISKDGQTGRHLLATPWKSSNNSSTKPVIM